MIYQHDGIITKAKRFSAPGVIRLKTVTNGIPCYSDVLEAEFNRSNEERDRLLKIHAMYAKEGLHGPRS